MARIAAAVFGSSSGAVASKNARSAFIVSGTFNTALALWAFFYVVGYLLSFLSVFALRRKEPDTPRPFRTPGYPVTTGLAVLGSVGFLAASVLMDWGNSWKSMLLLGLSFPVYRAVVTARGRSDRRR